MSHGSDHADFQLMGLMKAMDSSFLQRAPPVHHQSSKERFHGGFRCDVLQILLSTFCMKQKPGSLLILVR